MEEEEEEGSGSSAEERSMSPLHQEEEVLPIVSREEFDLMTRVLDEQPILGSSVSGQRCICSAGALPLAKYHPYVRSNYFKGQLRGLPSSEAFRTNYLRARRTGRSDYRRSGREADDECSGVEERRTMNAQELRAVVLHSSQRGLMIRQVLESLSQVMDQIQIQQLLLLARSGLMAMDEVSDGAGVSEGGTLAEEVAESVLAEDTGDKGSLTW